MSIRILSPRKTVGFSVTTAFTVALLWSTVAPAAEFYVDPSAGSTSGDGSQAHPWRRLQDLVDNHLIRLRQCTKGNCTKPSDYHVSFPNAPVGPGDTIWLRSGNHGSFVLSNAFNDKPIHVRAVSGQTPILRKIRLYAVSYWTFTGLTVTTGSINACRNSFGEPLILIGNSTSQGESSHVDIDSCHVSSWTDTSQWSADVWNQRTCSGIRMEGPYMTVRDNVLKNIYQGIQTYGHHSQVQHNQVLNFSGDAMRGLGDDSLFEDNLVKNAYCVNYPKDHDDAFQTWSLGTDNVSGHGTVSRITVRRNTIIQYDNPSRKYIGVFQGIGCMDGFCNDFIIENNVIATGSWHGITMQGAIGGRIRNNTIININPNHPIEDPTGHYVAKIMVRAHKDGRPSKNVQVWNNLAEGYELTAGMSVSGNNLVVQDAANYYVNPAPGPSLDLHLLATSPAVDKASPAHAPATDRDGVTRPQGSAPDIGAYEWVDPTKPDAGGNHDAAVQDAASDVHTPQDAQSQGDASEPPDATAHGPDSSANNPDGASGQDALPQTDAANTGGGVLSTDEANGCACRTTPGSSTGGVGWLLIAGLGLLGLRRRSVGGEK